MDDASKLDEECYLLAYEEAAAIAEKGAPMEGRKKENIFNNFIHLEQISQSETLMIVLCENESTFFVFFENGLNKCLRQCRKLLKLGSVSATESPLRLLLESTAP